MTKQEILDRIQQVIDVTAEDSAPRHEAYRLWRDLAVDIEAEGWEAARQRAFASGPYQALAPLGDVGHVRTRPVRGGPPPIVLSLPAGAEVTIRLPSSGDDL